MIFINATNENLDRSVKNFCAPLFATEHFLNGGHDKSTINATVTFVQHKTRVYAVTCHHVIAAFRAESLRKGKHFIPSIHSGVVIRQFGAFRDDGAYYWSFKSCRDFVPESEIDDTEANEKMVSKNANRPDIAIADITEVWSAIHDAGDADVINLDNWVEPIWGDMQHLWMAFGYPTAHKYQENGKVIAPMPRVTAELASSLPTEDNPKFVLGSTLDEKNNWGFSGLSGGPVLAAHSSDDRCAFVGITYEGFPSDREVTKNDQSFLTEKNIVLKAHYLTPLQFEHWLNDLQYGVRFEIKME